MSKTGLQRREAPLFSESPIEQTARVARAAALPEADVRAWAQSHGVERFGRAFAWTSDDVEALQAAAEGEEAR
jgi:hypothetical protein